MTSFPITTRLFFIIPSALFELDADTSVFIYLFPFLRYKLKRECVAMQTRFLNSGGHNSSTRKLKHKNLSMKDLSISLRLLIRISSMRIFFLFPPMRLTFFLRLTSKLFLRISFFLIGGNQA